jgi:hypothetical protein
LVEHLPVEVHRHGQQGIGKADHHHDLQQPAEAPAARPGRDGVHDGDHMLAAANGDDLDRSHGLSSVPVAQ